METKVIFSKKGLKRNGYTNSDVDNNYEEWERDYYSDDDDVFMETGSADKTSASKPLMHPRHRPKVKSRHPDCRCRKHVKPILCFILLVISLGSLMALIIYAYNKEDDPVTKGRTRPEVEPEVESSHPSTIIGGIRGCDNIKIEDVWIQGFPKLITESAFRLIDVNQDGILDIIVGFGTGADGYYLPDIVCDIYFNGTKPCFGGLLALEGATGKELWRHYSPHELFGVNCNADLDNDGVLDCLAGGRANAFQAVSGRTGKLLWNFDYQNGHEEIMNLYTPQIIRDLDGDGTIDILAMHGGDPLQEPGSKYRLSARILIFSGRTGAILRKIGVPDFMESYYSPQLYTLSDGTDMVLYGTGGETHPGSLWVITLDNLYKGDIQKSRAIYQDQYKGIMTPPVLMDLTGDGVEDIIMAMFNSSVLAIDGANFRYLWNTSFPMSESYSTPSPGYYNSDDVPDFLVKFAHGPGFPIYFYSETNILDGKTGERILKPSIRDTIGAQASGLTISVEGYGNDIFLYWISDCHGHEGGGDEFRFVEGTNVHEQSRSDLCRLRYKSKGFSRIYALNRHVKNPGVSVYFSDERRAVEKSKWVNTTKEAEEFLIKHPDHYQDYLEYQKETRKVEMERPENKYKNINRQQLPENGETLFNLQRGPSLHQTESKKGPLIEGIGSDAGSPYRQSIATNNYFDSPAYDDLGHVLQNVMQSEYGDVNDEPYYNKPYPDPYASYENQPRYRARNRHRYGGENQRIEKKAGIDNMRRKRMPRSALNRNELKLFTRGKTFRLFKGKNKNTEEIKNNKQHSNDKVSKTKSRKKRHIGPHDNEGLQRLLSTGTLVPTTLPPDHPHYNHSIEVVFATFWFYPAKTQTILPKDQKCIDKKLAQEKVRFSPQSKYYGLDHDKFQHVVTQECLQGRTDHHHEDHGTYQSLSTFNPYNMHMGQMTVYRLRLICTCSDDEVKSSKCGRILPFSEQQWYSYMGNKGDSHWKPRR